MGRTSVQCRRILRAARQGRARRVSAEKFPACSTGPRISRSNVDTLFGIHPIRVRQDSVKNARECEAIRACRNHRSVTLAVPEGHCLGAIAGLQTQVKQACVRLRDCPQGAGWAGPKAEIGENCPTVTSPQRTLGHWSKGVVSQGRPFNRRR